MQCFCLIKSSKDDYFLNILINFKSIFQKSGFKNHANPILPQKCWKYWREFEMTHHKSLVYPRIRKDGDEINTVGESGKFFAFFAWI